jgi:hypothetical protein
VITLLDTKPIEFGRLLFDIHILIIVQNKKEKAELLFLRGKALDYLPEYTKNAEEFLSKSIKLLPTN